MGAGQEYGIWPVSTYLLRHCVVCQVAEKKNNKSVLFVSYLGLAGPAVELKACLI